MIKKVTWFSRRFPFSQISMTLEFSDFRKIFKYQISRKFIQWEPNCSMREDGRTDMTKRIVALRNFAKAPRKEIL